VPQDKYLSAGTHIGTRTKNGGMRQFIYKARDDGLHVLDLKKLDVRVRAASSILAKYDAATVFVVGGKDNAVKPVQKTCELTGFQPMSGRFTPGRFTNPSRPDFAEPEIVLVVDPASDKQAVKEASYINCPVVALCDTNNSTKNVDLVIPTNNKGRKAIAFVLWLLTREILLKRGSLESADKFMVESSEFEG